MKVRAILLLAILTTCTWSPAFEVLFDAESAYHHVRVTEDDGYRYLSFDETRGTQSAMKVNDPTFLEYVYTRLAMAGLTFIGEPKDVLFVGLGGASMPKFFRKHYPNANMDVAEIDPVIVEVARKFFGFGEDPKTRVFVKDGRVFLSKIDKQYDMIVLDAYNTNSIPFHLTTKEFMEEVRRRLKPEGVVVTNIWSPELNEYFEAEIKTMQATFPELYIFEGGSSGNYIFISTVKPGQIQRYTVVDRARELTREKKFHFDLGELVKSSYQYATKRPSKGEVLTDNHAPVDKLRSQKTE